ncbi:PIG-L family deacetylase [soil metagenome]
MKRLLLALTALLLVAAPRSAPEQERGAATMGKRVEQLGTTARVLVVAAHPDDEDTNLITWLARGRGVETAYLSLTRGDGGQNLIGNELGEALGVIRAEELLAARRIDGGRQFFTRAYDFGFSKSAEETFRHWPRDSILEDVVTVVRAFRPHVIVSVFSGTPRDGHGQHQAAGILAREAYDLAGDTVRFPRAATGGLGPWTPLKFYRGARFNREAATLSINVGEYDPLLGRSYAEIAGESRSQHKSQGFGALQRKGPLFTYVMREHSRADAPQEATEEQSLLDGVPASLAELRSPAAALRMVPTLDSLQTAISQVWQGLDLFAPERSVTPLTRVAELARRGTTRLPCARDGDGSGAGCGQAEADLLHSLGTVAERAERAALEAAGIAVEVLVDRSVVAAGDSLPAAVMVYNRGRMPVEVREGSIRMGEAPNAAFGSEAARELAPDSVFRWTGMLRAGGTVSTPSWLELPREGATFTPPGASRTPWEILQGGSGTQGVGRVQLRIGGTDLRAEAPIEHRFADPVRGEVRRELHVVPTVSVLLDRTLEYAPANTPIDRVMRVHLTPADTSARLVQVSLRLPGRLRADSASRTVILPPSGTRTLEFRIRGSIAPGNHTIAAVAESGRETFTQGYLPVEYEHIMPQKLYREATIELHAVDLQLPARREVAYIPGVSDNLAPMLEQLGISVTLLDPAALRTVDLSRFRAVVIGPRAYEARPELVENNVRLLEYVRRGGTMVVQYGQYEMIQPGIMPYPITLARPHNRVTDEEAPVRFVHPDHPLLRVPNRITQADFEGWVQERGLYMPLTFDDAYTPLLVMSDPGEEPNQGAILVAQYGRGTYVYTSLAFFRQLPAGVPGAARLFVNLLGAGR